MRRRASVQRCERSKEKGDEFTIAMRFEKVSAEVGQRIRKTMEIYARGPARLGARRLRWQPGVFPVAVRWSYGYGAGRYRRARHGQLS